VYNKVGQVTRITKANGTSQSLSYDAFGRLKTSTDEYGNITTLSYDMRSLVTQKSQQVA
jgi:YD repeat-containing protein